METGVVCSEAEMSMLSNSLNEYIDFLQRAMDEYIKILSDIQEMAIKDGTICSALSSIESELRARKLPLWIEKGQLSEQMKRYIRNIEDADKFQFPNEFGAKVSALLARML